MAWAVSIGGVDHTADVGRVSAPTITRTLNERARARFQCQILPARFTDVVCYAKDGVTPIFGGVVMKRGIVPYADARAPFWTDVDCADYFTYFDWAYVSLSYTAPVALETVMNDLVAALPGSYGITVDAAQVTGPTLAPFVWDRKRASDAVRELSDRSGYVSMMSPLKAWRMFVPGTDPAPFALSAVGRHFTGCRWTDSDKAPANKVTVICGPATPQPVLQTWTQAGGATSWVTDIPAAPGTFTGLVHVDDGVTPYNATVGTGAMFEWDAATSTLTLGTLAVPANGTLLSVWFTAQFPFAVTATSGATPVIEFQQAFPDVTDYAQAQEIAAGLLAQLDQQPRELDIASLDDGWLPGQSLTIALATERLFAAAALITSVSITLHSDNVWRYALRATESGTYTGSYLDQWRNLTGGGSSVSSVSGGGGAVVTTLASPVYLGGARSASVNNPVAKTLIPNAVPYVATATFTGRLRVNLRARDVGVGVKAIISDGTTDVATSVITNVAFVDTSVIVPIISGHTYLVYVQNAAAGDGYVGYATLEAA